MKDRLAFSSGGETVYENKWIFMSPDGSGFQFTNPTYGTHGAVWWFFYFAAGPTLATIIAARYPNGAYWMYTFVK